MQFIKEIAVGEIEILMGFKTMKNLFVLYRYVLTMLFILGLLTNSNKGFADSKEALHPLSKGTGYSKKGHKGGLRTTKDDFKNIDPSYRYAVSLISSLKPIDPASIPRLDIFRRYILYTTVFVKDGNRWHRLRLGFFRDVKDARKVLYSLQETFPTAWVTKVSMKERRTALVNRLSIDKGETPMETLGRGATKTEPGKLESKEATQQSKEVGGKTTGWKGSISKERLSEIMEEAKKAMTEGRYRRAVQLYTKVLQYPKSGFEQDALELLGLARERNGQLAHAKAIYRKYLAMYPEGEGAERVRQRLYGILTAGIKHKAELRSPKGREADGGWKRSLYGSFSLFYNRDESFTDAEGSTVNRSSLNPDLDFNFRLRNPDYDIQTQFIGGYEQDFIDEDESGFDISTFYIDALYKRRELSLRIGRQSHSSSGVLGRFDGGLLGYQIHPLIKINGVAGFPVSFSTSNGIDTDKYFYGLSMDVGTIADVWDFNVFFIEQEVDDITDRRAVGGEIRYFKPSRSFFNLIDYDISYGSLNTFLFVANLIFPDRSTINLSIDYRKSPILTTSNALQGQDVGSISELLERYDEDTVRSLAEDRTAISRSLTVGASHPLNTKFQVNGDLTISNTSSTKTSGGVEGTPGTGNEFFSSVQLIGSSLIKEGDITILGLRYSNTSSSDSVTLNLNTRYPFNRDLRFNPRLRGDYKWNRGDNGEQITITPSFRLEYRWRRKYHFEVEAGLEWSSDRLSDQTDDRRSYFFSSGYRMDF